MIPAAQLTVAVIAAAGITGCLHPSSPQTHPAQPAPPSGQITQYAPQTVLPFTGLTQPDAVAVDTAGNLYVADTFNNRVVELAAGSSTQSGLPFTGVNHLVGVAVDSAGTVYVTDVGNSRVVKLPGG